MLRAMRPLVAGLAMLTTGCAHQPDARDDRYEEARAKGPFSTTHCASSLEAPSDVLALSGGGYRAMLFHVGALWRLNELGCLRTLRMVSSVSGGSIVAGVLAANWSALGFDEPSGIARNFPTVIARPLIDFASTTRDASAIAAGLLSSRWANALIEEDYDALFGGKTLGQLPDLPKFLINASNYQTGQLWTFSKTGVGDDLVGYAHAPNLALAAAVTASSAYPPFLAPYVLSLNGADWKAAAREPGVDSIVTIRDQELGAFQSGIKLIDGGVIDNLGMESIWKELEKTTLAPRDGSVPSAAPAAKGEAAIFVSNGGSGVDVDATPPGLYSPLGIKRIVDLTLGQHDALRERILIESFKQIKPDGVYWRIHAAEWHCGVEIGRIDPKEIESLARIPTRLRALDRATIHRLVNWGYLSADRAMPYLGRLWELPPAEAAHYRRGRNNEAYLYASDALPFPDAPLKLLAPPGPCKEVPKQGERGQPQ